MTEVFLIEMIEFLTFRFAWMTGLNFLALTLAPGLELLRDLNGERICQPKDDKECRAGGNPVRQFAAVEIGHRRERTRMRRNKFWLTAYGWVGRNSALPPRATSQG